MNRHPFDIPEILNLICQSLDCNDRLSWILVCRKFHEACIPFIWRNVTVQHRGEDRPGFLQGLQRHNHHIHTLYFSDPIGRQVLSMRGYDCLQNLHVNTSKHSEQEVNEDTQKNDQARQDWVLSQVSDLLAANGSTLRHVTLNMALCSRFGPLRKLWSALKECSTLYRLDLHGIEVHEDEIGAFLQACAKPRYLEFYGLVIRDCHSWFDHTIGDSIRCTDKTPENNKKLDDVQGDMVLEGPRVLKMEGSYEGASFSTLSAQDQAMFVRKCHNLESFWWSTGYKYKHLPSQEQWDLGRRDATSFCRTLAMGPWTLPHLESLCFRNMSLSDQDLSAILTQMSQLKELQAGYCEFGPISFQALAEVRTGAPSLFESVQRLQLKHCSGLTSKMVQLILASCPKLKMFIAPEIAVTDIARGQNWVCTELEVLHVFIVSDTNMDNDSGRAMHHAVHGQLGRLSQLERLIITAGPYERNRDRATLDLRLEAGLCQLAGLKRLREFVFSSRVPQKMGVREAEWMVESWPELSRIRGPVSQDSCVVTEMAKMLRQNKRRFRFETW